MKYINIIEILRKEVIGKPFTYVKYQSGYCCDTPSLGNENPTNPCEEITAVVKSIMFEKGNYEESIGDGFNVTFDNGDSIYIMDYDWKEYYRAKSYQKAKNEYRFKNFWISTIGIWKEINEIPEGFKLFSKSSDSSSEYYTNDLKDTIVRVSDHWGSGLGQCNWYLDGYEKRNAYKWKEVCDKENITSIGIISINDLKTI